MGLKIRNTVFKSISFLMIASSFVIFQLFS